MKPGRVGDETNPNWLWLMAVPFVFMCAGPVSAFIVSPANLTRMRHDAARKNALDRMATGFRLIIEAADKKGGKLPELTSSGLVLSAAISKRLDTETIGYLAACEYNRSLSQKELAKVKNPGAVWLMKAPVDKPDGDYAICFADGVRRIVSNADAKAASKVTPEFMTQ